MSLKDKTIVVTGGSRGLGLGLVEALVGQGAKVTVVARDPAALAAVEQRLGVATISADVTDKGHARRILADVRPEILVLNAGATPRMGRLDQLSWADFTATWETDVKAGLYWLQAALPICSRKEPEGGAAEQTALRIWCRSRRQTSGARSTRSCRSGDRRTQARTKSDRHDCRTMKRP